MARGLDWNRSAMGREDWLVALGRAGLSEQRCKMLFLYREVFERKQFDWSETVRATVSRRVPVVLKVEEVRALLRQLEGTTHLMARLMYGSRLRLRELIRLRVNQLDFERGVVVVRGGKGDKDRETVLVKQVQPDLREHLKRVKRLQETDLACGHGTVWLPEAHWQFSPLWRREEKVT